MKEAALPTWQHRLILSANVGQLRRYLVTFRTPDRPEAQFGVSRIEIVARGMAEAFIRACLDLDDVGVRDWTHISTELMST